MGNNGTTPTEAKTITERVLADPDSLALIVTTNTGTAVAPPATLKVAETKPVVNSRRDRQRIEEERRRQQNIIDKAHRIALAEQATVAVVVCAAEQMDICQDALVTRLYGVQRRKEMNEFMRDFSAEMLSLARAGIKAHAETAPKLFGEEL